VKIVIIGCGIVGATLAYELSKIKDYQVTVVESRSHPAQEATGAALGLLMGVISQKIKGRAWQWRQEGLNYYQKILPELASIGLAVPHNSQGLLKLIPDPADLAKWQSLVNTRTQQGWPLEIWRYDKILGRYPWLQITDQTSAIHSSADWQVHPAQLTRSLVTAAERQGVQFHWQNPVLQITDAGVETARGFMNADRLIITAGLGSVLLTAASQQPIELMPVLGQAIHYRLSQKSADDQSLHPVITCNDVHTVPLGQGEYWVGATVEFPIGTTVLPTEASLADLKKQAINYFPALATAEILSTWSGLRPRPVGRPAPIIEKLPGYQNIIVATGHYRNGILLAPATARMVREILADSRP
jgi:glycine/D-amino acid oxidase-like deaminating enzyme